MSDKLKVIIANEQKRVKIETGIRMLLRRCCHAVLETEGFVGSAEIGIAFHDNPGFNSASVQYHGILSDPEAISAVFETSPMDKVKKPGLVIISVEQAKEVAALRNMPFSTRLAYLTANGVLELLGYPEGRRRDTEKYKKVVFVLRQLGLSFEASFI